MKFRLAMRHEGSMWNAYAAQLTTMDGAVLIGSIGMGAVVENPARKNAFMEMMQGVLAEFVRDAGGSVLKWNPPERAPEAERAGHG